MAIKIFLVTLAAYFCFALDENIAQIMKEDACMNLLEYMIKAEKAKFDEIFNLRPNLRKKELREKLTENAFSFCAKTITELDAEAIFKSKSNKLPAYFYLLPLNIDNIHHPEDLALDPNWPKHRREVKKRLNRMRRKMKNPNDL